ncbi:MAG: hypothetical protein KGH69_04510 [Candidatus Micrarchaeota archaeon]|nr:hypothetical protein [Candidatus Micrarchaeota archaeon]
MNKLGLALILAATVVLAGAYLYENGMQPSGSHGPSATTAASSIPVSTSQLTTAQTNYSSSSNASIASAMQACSNAGIPESQCQSYCESNPQACGFNGQAQQANSTTVPTTTVAQTALSTQDFIVAVPVNLSQISQISKFRSCVGHDYSGYDVNGTLETNRSMKHYFTPSASYAFTTGRIQELAPFNGTVVSITREQTPIGYQVWIADATSNATVSYNGQTYPTPGIWTAIFFHMDPASGIAVGSKVSAGELIGYANQSSNEQTFDIALANFSHSSSNSRETFDSIFNHMDQSVLVQFAQHGVNRSNIVISKAYRDSHPCTFSNYPYFTGPPSANESVTLNR